MPTPSATSRSHHAFLCLHLSILLAGFTGVLGKLISIGEWPLVWYRTLMTVVLFACILFAWKKLERISWQGFLRVGFVGVLLCVHWIFFYGSIKASNVSIGVICFALVGLFTALLEPIILHKRFSVREILFSLLSLAGVALIFSFDARYRLGIALGVAASLVGALFTITSKKVCVDYSTTTLLLYQMVGGFLFMSVLMPFYLYFVENASVIPSTEDWIGLFCLAFFCTIGMNLLQLQALRTISAFTVSLSYNLEPIYSIVIAIAFLGEAQELGISFYAGLGLILVSVGLQTGDVLRQRHRAG